MIHFLNQEKQAIASINEQGQLFQPLTVYHLADSFFELSPTQIPYYERGRIVYVEDDVFKQHEEGHQPWLSNPIDVVTVNCSNLIAQNAMILNEHVHYSKEELKTKNGISIKLLEEKEEIAEVEMIVPGLGKYHITLRSPKGTMIYFISRIQFHMSTK
ncbi:hypothetical protein BJL90_07760 [Clostridium formicaceticum]|nr:hypothetical protein BJL90_07760 [Clostridium formicaceticum]